jgi:diacylglycerol kinase family enzyme
MTASPGAPIPAFVNSAAGSAPEAREAIGADPRFALHEVAPAALAEALRAEVARGVPRVLVAGGDGTIATAAGALAGTNTALAVLPGGTLNHFARDLGLPVDDRAACLELAATGPVRRADVGWVNDRLFLGTSSLGTYILFVRTRERLERLHLGYHLASFLAAVRIWFTLRGFAVEVREPAGVRYCRTPQLFVGVGERALGRPAFGARVDDGSRSLHLIVVRETARARLITMALTALARGLEEIARTDSLDAILVDECTVAMRRPWGTVSIDGELVRMRSPLHYRVDRDALAVVAAGGPAAAGPEVRSGRSS